MKRAFFYKDEKSDKFWAIHAEGEAFAVHYGKTGTAGKFDIKEFGDADECAKAAEKLIRSKQAKGYKEAPDFDFSAQIYIDTDEIGPHRLSSHPRFAAHFTDDFYYDCGDEEAPFGSDEGSDTLNLLEEYIRKNRNGDIVYFPQRVMEKDWGMEYIPPDFFDEAGIKAEIAKPDDAIPRSQLLTINDQVIIATALGQIKIMGEVSQRLKVHAQNALRRLNLTMKLLGFGESETLQKTLADLEAFRNAEEITPSKDCAALMEYLDCPCRVFTGLLDDDDMVFAYEQAAMRGKAESFTPLLIVVSDILTEAVAMAADENDDLPDREKGRAWRKEVLRKAEEIDAKAFLDSRFKEYADDEGNGEYAEEIKTLLNRTLKGKDTRRRVSAFWDYEAQLTKEVILAEIPTAKPYELAAYVPMGGFNDCPDPETQVAVMKRWYEKYGAIPAVVTYDEWEFIVPEPLADEAEALVLAAEHFAFCADRLEQYRNGYTLGMLAKSLTDSTVWYFWWD